MKLTTDRYLNKAFHVAKSWDMTHRAEEGINKKKSVFWPNFDHFSIVSKVK